MKVKGLSSHEKEKIIMYLKAGIDPARIARELFIPVKLIKNIYRIEAEDE